MTHRTPPDLVLKKSLGQNFMVEESILHHMADAADVGPDDAVLEIGAGLGALTEVLATRARRVAAVEIDGRFIPHLHARFADLPGVEIVEADILHIDLAALLGTDAAAYKAVGNLPYYITSPILRHLLEGPCPPTLAVVTVQHEVGLRMAARPGDMSLLAVGVQFYGTPQIVQRLKPGVFHPRPEVDSALMRITPHPGGPPLAEAERTVFFRIARAGFSQPRKQIKNTLSAGLHLPVESVVNWLMSAGIDPTRRAETLSVEDWLALHQFFASSTTAA